jgi:hypothetical protein
MQKSPRLFFLAFCLCLAAQVYAQDSPFAADAAKDDPSALVGMTLSDMFAKYGVPQTVYVSRGVETWQDDAVFVYPAPYGGIECYVYKDRIWQVGVKSALGVKIGDSRTAAALVLGENRQDFDNCALYPLAPKAWLLTLRLNFDANGKIQAIFIYRPDF